MSWKSSDPILNAWVPKGYAGGIPGLVAKILDMRNNLKELEKTGTQEEIKNLTIEMNRFIYVYNDIKLAFNKSSLEEMDLKEIDYKRAIEKILAMRSRPSIAGNVLARFQGGVTNIWYFREIRKYLTELPKISVIWRDIEKSPEAEAFIRFLANPPELPEYIAVISCSIRLKNDEV
jgi:hypothetical protein